MFVVDVYILWFIDFPFVAFMTISFLFSFFSIRCELVIVSGNATMSLLNDDLATQYLFPFSRCPFFGKMRSLIYFHIVDDYRIDDAFKNHQLSFLGLDIVFGGLWFHSRHALRLDVVDITLRLSIE